MQYYFIVQYRILNRRLNELGVRPFLGYILGLLVFVGLSYYLFYKTTYAAYLYVLLALSSLSKLSDRERNDFLLATFSSTVYWRIRLLENSLLASPFVLYLLYEGQWQLALLLMLCAVALSRIKFVDRLQITLPTPFYHFPFEFTQGFRKYWFLYLLAYFVGFKAVEVANFNLGVGSLVLVFLLGMIHCATPEHEYFVWIYSCSARKFLFKKIATALGYSSILALPLLLGLSAYFPDKLLILLGVQGLGYLFLLTMILAKYSAFPGEMSLPQAILLGLGLWFPPLLVVVIPLFYTRSVKRLNAILQ
ncbi:hypothetical protein [Haliscomenobacter hydrossis]|uniref:Uncharacterized protein n=1 Tax=Haliscomenobacter hydrossis (strain ATCC 27775 / DSM 1100 / LMG 10767 / O) TaxID=760192 RepID=F4KS98_HALH1|nr:hypothetical protein [Haliscomenobacter hydrossis]AEE53301.1 hypothetical protein Halhy_5476 [Haliscomenobacter hydrossis DSM 1100]